MTFFDSSIAGRGEAGSKLILFGEHAVVHGTSAIAAGLEKGISATATFCDEPSSIYIKEWNISGNVSGNSTLDIALKKLLNSLFVKDKNIKIIASSHIPPGGGLGSSASLGAASAIAVGRLLDLSLTSADIENAVKESESVFHNNPSGVDAAAVLYKGLFLFNKITGVKKIEAELPELLVFDTGVSASTAQSVDIFTDRLENDLLGVQNLNRIKSIVEEAVNALVTKDIGTLGALMSENHEILKWFGVSSPELDDICNISLKYFSPGAKMTGGGRGGCAIVLVSEKTDVNGMMMEMTQKGYKRVI
ncbi:MAG: mevalonate kinase [Deltaproteobacteria bacterium]|nr:mevalonate kinase [Deltaproteobacteria bacterium]